MTKPDNESDGKLDQLGSFISKNYNKGELALKHAVGLGAQPNVVPEGSPVHNGEPREVQVGWHPVGGLAGQWFADKTGLGKLITDKINKYPDPTQHWAVLVGNFAHQLWMDEEFHVIYTNEKVDVQQWKTFKVGQTHFNDDAIRRAGESVIQAIRDKEPNYNLITNNCQTYALKLLDAIKSGNRKEFGTTLAVYDRVFGPGKVADLFVKPGAAPDDKTDADGNESDDNTVNTAQQVMDDNTTKLDTQGVSGEGQSTQAREVEAENDQPAEDEKKKKKGSFFSKLISKTKSKVK